MRAKEFVNLSISIEAVLNGWDYLPNIANKNDVHVARTQAWALLGSTLVQHPKFKTILKDIESPLSKGIIPHVAELRRLALGLSRM